MSTYKKFTTAWQNPIKCRVWKWSGRQSTNRCGSRLETAALERTVLLALPRKYRLEVCCIICYMGFFILTCINLNYQFSPGYASHWTINQPIPWITRYETIRHDLALIRIDAQISIYKCLLHLGDTNLYPW